MFFFRVKKNAKGKLGGVLGDSERLRLIHIDPGRVRCRDDDPGAGGSEPSSPIIVLPCTTLYYRSIKAFVSHGKACGQHTLAFRKCYDWFIAGYIMQLKSTLHVKVRGTYAMFMR